MQIGVGFSRATTEGAEFTPDKTNVGEVDIAIDYVGDQVADEIAAKRVGGYEEGDEVRPVGVGQGFALFVAKAVCVLFFQDAIEGAAHCRRGWLGGFFPR